MQGKGLIRFFAILLAIVCLFQYFLMWKTNNIEKAADAYAVEQVKGEVAGTAAYDQQVRTARSQYLDNISQDTVFTIPLIAKYTYNDLKKATLNLGLDLKGGMSAALDVDLKEMVKTLANNSKNQTFQDALEQADQASATSQSDYITLFADAYQSLGKGKKLSTLFSVNPTMREEINAESTDGEVIAVLRKKADETVNLTFEMLKERIDGLGVVQPNVTLDENRDLILVEMPGIDNPQRARDFLETSAKLEFWETYRISDPGVAASLNEANRQASLNGLVKGLGSIDVEPSYTYSYDPITGEKSDSTINEVANTTNNGLAALMEFNDSSQPRYSQAVLGFADRKNVKKLDSLFSNETIKRALPNDLTPVWTREPVDVGNGTMKYAMYGIKKDDVDAKPPVSGEVVTDASASPDQNGQMSVSLTMNNKGAKEWGNLTTRAANNGQREIAILLDDEVVSAPFVRNPITGGRSSIDGAYTVQEANDLAKILSIGKLPAKTTIVSESTVGPTLGKENISRSINSLIFGVIILLLFMVLYYGGAGIVSIIALLLNVFFIFGALANFGTVLTIPGIAGIILTIGMAVDANVIIYERVREELRSGKSLLASIKDGFSLSYSAIIDANVTTIIVAIVLGYFGLGPIKGFAVVLGIGVLLSLLTAVLLGRLIIDWWTVKKGKNLTFWTPPFKNAFANLNVDWLGKRKIAYVVSGVIILAGIASLLTQGLNYGVDFKGGYQYEVQFPEGSSVDAEALRSGLATVLDGEPIVKEVSSANTYSITTDYLIDVKDSQQTVNDALAKGLNTITGSTVDVDKFMMGQIDNGPNVRSSATIGPTIAKDIKRSSMLAALIALILIFAYIFARFSKWQYSMGAVAALAHDSFIVIAIFSICKNIMPFSLELDQAFIAAVLTVIGYSINDTVVVFDRIREYLGIYTSKTTDEVLNMAINSTFSRTVITSLTTLFVVLCLFIFGSGSIKGFAFALLVGVLVGTYSSIFVATPLLRDFTKDLRPKVKKNEKKGFSGALHG